MTGADIVGALVCGHAPLIALVPNDRIKFGRLGDVQLPAIMIRVISSVERQRLKRGTTVRLVDRVSVSVRAASYREQRLLIELITEACADQVGDIAGARSAAVLTWGRGPDLIGPADSFEQAQDFRVSFDKPVPQGE